ncbi:hypothetical protein [Cupriavidus oxalaticus]|uniref:Uncharacterized protein n=1 Tax=Cupriavidus oxalaticus TaxID=96344 RepID=A0A4P7LTY1_9BURK|nr:hypothetical protein [Cupriavidus oxalaticus]QBY56087.1 hypothetical protein E0W60_34110 [Cupriavidus oxalaticus]
MSQTNHFDAHLETSEHDDPQHDISQDDVTDVSTSEKPKRKLPTNYLIYGAVAVAVLGFWGFKKMTKPSSPAGFAASAPMNDGGMMGAAANPERPAPGSFAPVRQAQQETAAQGFAPSGADPAMSNSSLPASASESVNSASASVPFVASLAASATNDAAEIATGKPGLKNSDRKEMSDADAAILQQLKAQTVQLEDMGKRLSALETRRVDAKTASKPARASKPLSDEDRAREKAAGVVRTKATRSRTNSKEEVQLGYKIKQVIPGQAWLEDDTGKQYVKAKGDKLGGSEIVEIDADKFIVRTTAGVIR